MIVYSKKYWGFELLTRYVGSAVPRSLLWASISTVIVAILKTVGDDYVVSKRPEGDLRELFFINPYPFQIFAFILGFAIVFRNNFGYNRWWEGRSNLQVMTNKWQDALLQMYHYDWGTMADRDSKEKLDELHAFINNATHLISLMHAVALQSLRTDFNLRNLAPHFYGMPIPPYDSRDVRRGNIKYDTDEVQAHPGEERELSAITEDSAEQLNKPKAAYGRKYRDNPFWLRSNVEDRAKVASTMPIPVIGYISYKEFEALGGPHQEDIDQFTDISKSLFKVPTVDVTVPGCGERVYVILGWIYELCAERIREGGLKIPPPIMSRIYTCLSDGLMGYENCRKLMDTQFPFPWAQIILILVILFVIMLPFVIAAYVGPLWAACVGNFVCVLSYWSLHEISYDIEEPFVYDPNDLPLPRYQYMLNERLLALTHNPRPTSTVEGLTMHLLRMERKQQVVDMQRRTNFTQSKGANTKLHNVSGLV